MAALPAHDPFQEVGMPLDMQFRTGAFVALFGLAGLVLACSDPPTSDRLTGLESDRVPLNPAARLVVDDAMSRLIPSLQDARLRDDLRNELTVLVLEGVSERDSPLGSIWLSEAEVAGADAADLAALALGLMAVEEEASETPASEP